MSSTAIALTCRLIPPTMDGADHDDCEIICQRIVFVDSEFDARVNKGEPPGSPICICAIEVGQNGLIMHKLAAPYPRVPPWHRDHPYLTVGFALGAEAGSFLHVNWPFPCRVAQQ